MNVRIVGVLVWMLFISRLGCVCVCLCIRGIERVLFHSLFETIEVADVFVSGYIL